MLLIADKRNRDAGFMNKSMVILGKIRLGEEVEQSLISKKDFENWKRYEVLKELFRENLPKDLDVNSPTFRLDKALNIINNSYILRSLTTKESIEVILLNKPLRKKLLKYYADLKLSVNNVIEKNLHKRNPTWKPETIVRKA